MDTQKKKSKETTSKKRDFTRYGKTVRISQEIYDFIIVHGNFQESFSDVLKRLLKLN